MRWRIVGDRFGIDPGCEPYNFFLIWVYKGIGCFAGSLLVFVSQLGFTASAHTHSGRDQNIGLKEKKLTMSRLGS